MTPVRVERERKEDKGPRRYKQALHYLAGFVLGWYVKAFFPEYDRIVELVGAGWVWLLGTVAGLGGVAVLTSSALGIFSIYKWVVERRDRKEREKRNGRPS